MLDSLDRIDRLDRRLRRLLEGDESPVPLPATELPGLGDLPLLDLIPRFNPGLRAPYHLPWLVDHIESAIAPHEGQRFFWFSVPPRHWKTVTLLNGAAKHLLRWPTENVAYVSHDAAFAAKQSADVRSLIEQRAGIDLAYGSNKKTEWELKTGGGFVARGIGSKLTGRGFRLIIVDDPIAGRDDANSPAAREFVWNAIEEDILTRLTPDGVLFLVHTRWHPDDPIGRYKKRKQWEGLNIAALSGPNQDIPLLPDVWKLDFLRQKRDANPYSFEALYQGNPILPGSQLFRDPARFDWVEALPTQGYRVAYGVDLAYSAKTAGDWSVCVRLLKVVTTDIDPVTNKPIALYYVTDVQRKHVDAPSFALTLKAMHTSQPGPMLWYAATSELGAGQFIADRLPGFRFAIAKVDKLQRAQRVSEAWNLGRVLVPGGENRPEWVEDFIDELTNFTGVKDAHDDQVDSLAAAFDLLNDEAPNTPPGKLQTYESPLTGW